MTNVAYRINCGSTEPFLDADGNIWQADMLLPLPDGDVAPPADKGGFCCVGGKSVTREADLPLFPSGLAGLLRTECYDMTAYRLALPAGTYTVRLILAETFETLASLDRRFTLTLNGKPLADAIQPGAIAQGFCRAGECCLRGVIVAGEGLEIGFSPGANLYGMEVIAEPSAPSVKCIALAPSRNTMIAEEDGAVLHRPRILFVGHSGTFFWAIPETVARMVALRYSDLRLQVDAYYAGGKGVRFFLDSMEVRRRLRPGAFDFVVLQDNSAGPIDNPAEFMSCMPQLIEMVKDAGAQPILYAYSGPINHSLAQHQQLQHLYDEIGRHMQLPVVPCAAALAHVLQHDPAQNYLNPDQHHLGMMGGYLFACCWYRALCGESAMHLPEHATLAGHVEIPAKKARMLAEVSDEICLRHGIGTRIATAILSRYLMS